MRTAAAVLVLLILPATARAGDPLPGLPRPVFEAELRAAILATGDMIADILAPPSPVAREMQEKVAEDLALLASLAPEVLAGHDIALFTAPDCAPCSAASEELSAFVRRYGKTFIQHDMSDPGPARWAAALGLEEPPFYVLPNLILNGQIPQVALKKYLAPKAHLID